MDILSTSTATANGGREGHVQSTDGVINLDLAIQKGLGGPGGAKANPETLFAAGYAACFHSAVQFYARNSKIDVSGSEITAHVGIGKDDTSFALEVTLEGKFPSLDQQQAHDVMEKAHQICPYSKATRGNIPVTLTVV